jgi:hypothetical protein
MRRLASARVSRCPSGGGKIAFVFPIRLAMTQRYIEGDTEAKRKLVALL